jgi:hypothetical protein
MGKFKYDDFKWKSFIHLTMMKLLPSMFDKRYLQ